jgi:hypothetical protein
MSTEPSYSSNNLNYSPSLKGKRANSYQLGTSCQKEGEKCALS